MSSAQTEAEREDVEVEVDNIGGIDHTDVSFTPGVTILPGRNATNRTSLLQALMAALGSEHVSLKGNAEEGHAELTVGDSTYMRTLERTNGTTATSSPSTSTDGKPYLEGTDAELADLFAFLLESNEARRAVAQSDDLRDLIMRPVDTDAIQSEITQLESEKRQLETEIDQLDTLEDQLPELEAELTDLDEQIADKRDALDEAETELDDADADIDETREEKAELEDKLDELSSARSVAEDARLDIESERKSIEALQEERADLEGDLDTQAEESEETASPAAEIDEIETELEQKRDRLQSLETTVNELQTVIQFNEDMLEGDTASTAVLNALRDGDEETSAGGDRTDALTNQLLADTDVVCWTCGSEIDQERIETTLDRLREVRTEHFEERRSLKSEIDELETRKEEIETQRRQREQQQRELRTIEAEIDDREARIENLKETREEREHDVEDLEAEVEDLQEEEYSELLDLHKQANQLEFEVERLQREREETNEEIESVEAQLDNKEQLEDQREQLQTELTDLRGRIEHIENEAITEFNEHMQTVLGLLEYANIDRIWLERRETDVREGRRKVSKSVFDLHVVRTAESGTTYEDTVEHLSESEREVTGLVFALAGYLAHDLHEHLPFMLVDSLETIDSDRIAALVEHFSEYATYLVVALLPEDAAALDEDYQRVTEI
jgi:chromosome segregation ATPase